MKKLFALFCLLLLICGLAGTAMADQAQKNIQLTVGKDKTPLTISTVALPDGKEGVLYTSTQLTFTGGGSGSSTTWSATGTLPSGITLSTSGVLSGTPVAGSANTYTITVKATQPSGRTASKSLSLLIKPTFATLTITTTTIPDGFEFDPYTTTFAATGGNGSYIWTVFSGSLPAGLTLTTTGVLSGTPTLQGVYNFTIQVADTQTGAVASKTFSMVRP